MHRSKSFTSNAFEQKQKAAARKASPTRQKQPKPEWNDNLTDPSRFKVAEEEILKKKKMLVSKNNILVAEYRPTRLTSSASVVTSQPRSDSSYSASGKSPSISSSRKILATKPENNNKNSEHVDSLFLLSANSADEREDLSAEEDEDDDEENESFNVPERIGSTQISSTHLNSDEEEPSGRIKTYELAPPHRTIRNRSHKSKVTEPKNQRIVPSIERPRSAWSAAQQSSLVVSSPVPVASTRRKMTSMSKPTEWFPSSSAVIQQQFSQRMTSFVEKEDRIPDEDLLDIAQNIDHLQHELQMYEELAGKKSILDGDELKLILSTDESGSVDVNSLNQKVIIRSLVSLVCQTMTYTLQSEVKQQHMESEMQSMQIKFDEVLRMAQQQQQTNAAYSQYAFTTIPPSVASLSTPVASVPVLPPTPLSSSSISDSPSVAESPALSRSEAVTDNTTPTSQFYGTSTSDWLFMRSPKSANTKPMSPIVATAAAVTEEVQRTPSAAYEYQLSPETTADLATRTYDMYLQQQIARDQAARNASFDALDHYDDMVDRLTSQFSSIHKSTASGDLQKLFPAEGISIVVPNKQMPIPAKASPHPLQKSLFPASPATAKKIYDASLGNYSRVDAYDA